MEALYNPYYRSPVFMLFTILVSFTFTIMVALNPGLKIFENYRGQGLQVRYGPPRLFQGSCALFRKPSTLNPQAQTQKSLSLNLKILTLLILNPINPEPFKLYKNPNKPSTLKTLKPTPHGLAKGVLLFASEPRQKALFLTGVE